MKHVEVIIIGAGAAGMMCAIEAAKRGRKVLILEKTKHPGKKILMSGGGRCNFTNLFADADNYISHNPHFCKSALKRYTPWDFLSLVESHQIPYVEKAKGQLFCANKSSDIVEMLLKECRRYHVDIQTEQHIAQVQKTKHGFVINGQFHGESLVMATGGLSIPTLGSSPLGYEIAKQFGLRVYPLRAALVPLTLQPEDKALLSELSGIALHAEVVHPQASFTDNILFTHRGLSGPAILQISSYWQPGDVIRMNFLVELDLKHEFLQAQNHTPDLHLKNFLAQFFAKKMVLRFFPDQALDVPLKSVSLKMLASIEEVLGKWNIKPGGSEGYRTAEVTLGGVNCDDISSQTFEAHQCPGLYMIGELLDVTGWLGGYNFQWAWSSGWAAGQVV